MAKKIQVFRVEMIEVEKLVAAVEQFPAFEPAARFPCRNTQLGGRVARI